LVSIGSNSLMLQTKHTWPWMCLRLLFTLCHGKSPFFTTIWEHMLTTFFHPHLSHVNPSSLHKKITSEFSFQCSFAQNGCQHFGRVILPPGEEWPVTTCRQIYSKPGSHDAGIHVFGCVSRSIRFPYTQVYHPWD